MTREFTPQERGKIKRLTKQRDYWKKRFEEVDIVLRKYPKLMSMYGVQSEITVLKQSIREKEALIKFLDRKVKNLEEKCNT